MAVLDSQVEQCSVALKDFAHSNSKLLGCMASLLFIQSLVMNLSFKLAVSDSDGELLKSGIELHRFDYVDKLVEADLEDLGGVVDWVEAEDSQRVAEREG